jgi:hypothetical protein
MGNFRKSRVRLMNRKLLKGTIKIKPGLLAHPCNPSILLRQEDHKFKASLGYLLRHCLKGTEKKSKGDSC